MSAPKPWFLTINVPIVVYNHHTYLFLLSPLVIPTSHHVILIEIS